MGFVDWLHRLLQKRSLIFLFAALASFPFFLRTGLDLSAVKRQAVLSLYRDWRFAPEIRDLKTGSTVIFDRQDEKSSLEEYFKIQLQQDFRVAELGEFPRIRVFFDSNDFLSARIETEKPGDKIGSGFWEGRTRFINNGILLGAWLSLLVWYFRRSFKATAWTAVFAMLLWQSNWNLLGVPAFLWNSIRQFSREMFVRFKDNQWIATEMGRLAELGVVVWLIAVSLVYWVWLRKAQPKKLRNIAILSFVCEPLFIYWGSEVGKWGADVLWWKVYLGSFLFRFSTFSFLLLSLLKPNVFHFPEIKQKRLLARQFPLSMLLVPVVFVLSGGWEWLNCVLYAGKSETLLQLKIYFVGLLLGAVLGSRLFSLWLGLLVISILLPPTKGYWITSAWYGFMLDALLLGWWVTPLKGIFPVLASAESWRRFFAVAVMAWICGVFLSSVGVPLVVCWGTLGFGVWAYAQVSRPQVEFTELRSEEL